jgi:hypothetical protein
MKKLFLLFSLLMLCYTSNAQTGATCATAKVFANDSACITSNSLTGTEMWFKFIASNTSRSITLKGNLASTKRVDTLAFYSGTCTELKLLNYTYKNSSFPNDSALILEEYTLTIGNTYYVRASRASSASSAVFDLCLDDRAYPLDCGAPASIIPTPVCELLCNGNFESYASCSSEISNMENASCWNKFEWDPINYPGDYACWEPGIGTSDYFNANYCPGTYSFCSPSFHPPTASVPSNFAGTESSHNTGQAYGGILTFTNRTNNWVDPTSQNYNYREYIQQKLSHPLVIGQQYTFTMYVSLADSSAVATYIGALFSMNSLDPSIWPYPLWATPHVQSVSTITQKTGWTQITQTFTATAPYSWVIIGNFKTDSATNINVVAPSLYTTTEVCNGPVRKYYYGYYYIDDVSLVPVGLPPIPATINYTVPPSGAVSSVLFAGATSVTTKNISVQGTLTIDNNMTFLNCNFVMDPDVKINQTSGNLTLNTQTHLYGCAMWDGIYVPNTKSITTNGSAFIEDAKQAINLAQGSTANIQQTIFNKNLIAVELTANTNATSPLTMYRNVITSRNIPFTTNTTTNKTITDVISNITGVTTPLWLSGNMKAPYADRRSCYGIDAFDVTLLNVGKAISGQLNYFDTIMCGINLTRTNAVIYNNRFQNLAGYASYSCPGSGRCYYETGIGVQTYGTASTGTNTIRVGATGSFQPNTFSNTFEAVYAQYYKTHNIVGNSITNPITVAFNSGITVISPTAHNIIKINNQTLIKNCETGIYVYKASSTGTDTLMIDDNGNINTTTPAITSDGNANGYCNNGIFISDIVQGSVVPTLWEVKNNVIDKTYTCINLSSVKKPAAAGTFQYQILTNSVTALYKSSGNTNGIKAQNCLWLSIASNHTKYSGGSPWLGANPLSYGIYLSSSSNMLVKCNKIDDAARSLIFEGPCSSSPWSGTNIGILNNTINRSYDGFVLKTTGVIGTQGDATTWNSGNVWTGPFTNSETFADNTNNVNTASKLFMFNSAGYMPANNKSVPLGQQYVITTPFGLNVTSASIQACTPLAPAMTISTGVERSDPTVDLEKYSNELNAIEEDTTKFIVYNNEIHWMLKKFVYDELKKRPELNNKTSLQIFYSSTTTNYSKFAQVEDRMLNKQYGVANSINNGIVSTNILESNQQTINALILQPLLNKGYVYTTNDKKIINTIALQCPFSGGYAVYQARNIMMGIENKVIEFADNCDEKAGRSIETNIQNIVTENKSFNLYPNPNNGTMLLDYKINQGDKGMIKIYDLTGKLMFSYELNANTDQMQINNADLNNGIYMYDIIVNNKTVKTDKLVIIKQ